MDFTNERMSTRRSSRPESGRAMLNLQRRSNQAGPRSSNPREGNSLGLASAPVTREEESSDDSSVHGLTTEQQEKIDQIGTLKGEVVELRGGLRREELKSSNNLKLIEQNAQQIELLENRMNDDLSTRNLSLMLRQVIFNELPSVLEGMLSERFQVFQKLVDRTEKKWEAEIKSLERKEQQLHQQMEGLADHVHELEESVQAMAEASSSSEEDVQRHLAREASNKLFGGSQSPRVSRVALAQSVRSGTPLSTSHDAPEALGREDTLERAHREMLMGNGPRPDLESTRPEAPPVATHSTSSSPSRTVQGSTSSPSRPRGAAAAASPGGSPFFVEPNQDSSTTTVSTKRQEDEAQREEPEVQHSSQPRNAREPSSPTRLPKEILRKRKGPSLRSSRNSSFVMRHQRSSVSEMSEDEAMSPASGALPAALASGPGLTKLIEDTVADYVRSKDFISFINQQCDLPFVHQCIQRLSEMVPDLQAQQSEMQKELHQVDEDLQSSKATLHRSLELRATEETTAQLAKRVTKNEKFSEQGIDAILQSVEGRVLEFLSEGEAERARLWHQMSVLFPRFIQEGNEKKPMSVSEARAYALDVRLDSLEDFVVRRSGTPRRSRSFPAAAGRNLADVAEVTDGALVEDGHEEAEAADEDVGRSSGSRSFGFERFSFAPEAFKATPGSHLHEILERLKEQLASGAPSQAAAELLAEDAVHVGTASAPPSLLRRSKLENHTKSLSVTFEEPNQLKEAATGAATERMEVSPSPRPSGFQGLSEGGGSRSGEKPDPPEVDCFIYEPPEAPPQLVQVDSPRSLAVTSGQLAQAEGDVRTVDEALSDVLEGSRTQDLGEVQLIRALNPRSPNMWLIGDAAAGRVIGRRSEEVPSRRRTRPNTSR
ncbi:unnamed protein product [Durusdinium trenchii]|uniref:Uncharacterized protein n=3 Tax=Durusdinium trenchii TaxID=1381693 RepID=A0ABP0P3Z7_9DINO